MELFHEIPDAIAVTRRNGVFRQAKVFKYNGRIFVEHGNGFVWALKGGDTSSPTVRLEDIELPFEKCYNKLGYMCTPDAKDKR